MATDPTANPPHGLIVNISELAKESGRSVPTIKHWIRSGMPVVARGDQGHEWQIDLAAVFRWREETRGAKADDVESDDESSKAIIDRERARKLAAEADLAEMEREERRGQLIPIAIAAKGLADAIAEARTVLIAMPNKLAPVCAAEMDVNVVRTLIESEIHRSLTALSRGGLRRGDPGGEAELEAAAEANGEPVGGPLPKAEPGE